MIDLNLNKRRLSFQRRLESTDCTKIVDSSLCWNDIICWNNIIRWGAELALLMALTACSHSSSAEAKFVNYAQTLPPIMTPSGIQIPAGESYYPIPPIPVTQPVGIKPPLAPPGSRLAVQKKAVLPAPQ